MNIFDLDTGQELERLEIAREIAHRDDFATLIIDASVDGILVLDPEGCYTVWNKAMEKLSGIPRERVLGRNALELFPFLKEAGMDRVFQRVLKGEVVKSPAIPFEVAETGAKGFTEQTNVPIYNERKAIVGLLAVVRDVTDQKKMLDELAELRRLVAENRANERA
jgi:PAS domain S-box-containing protein